MTLEEEIAALDGWVVIDGKLTKSFTFEAFLDGIGFVQRVAVLAEDLDHHPDIQVRWRTVTLSVNTHDAGNVVTGKDTDLARRVDQIV